MNESTTPRSHWAARMSIIAAYTCFLGNCLSNQLIARFGYDRLGGLGAVFGWVTMGLVLAGVVLGIYGLVEGRRRRATDTMAIALIGLLLNSGILAVAFYFLWQFWRIANLPDEI